MNIDDFYKRFGRDTTTNFQLENYAKELQIKNFYMCMHNEINQLPQNKLPLNVIINIQCWKQRGMHMVCAVHWQRRGLFFDSYSFESTQ